MKFESKTVHIGVCTDHTGALSTPIYQSATFRHPALGQSTGYDYTRSLNPTRKILEDGIAQLEEGAAGYAFSSGMAAVTAVLMIYKQGDHIVIVEDCYGGTYRVVDKVFSQFGLEATFVDGSNIDEVAQAIKENTVAIIVETPTNPLMKIVDIRAMIELAKSTNAHCIVDNTFLTPYFQRPLALGADIVIHSGTKYLAGHNDLVCGLVVAREAELAEKIKYIQNSTGAVLSPNDSWLLIRSIKTLALRMDRHNANAIAVAQWLENHPAVKSVYYPGLDKHPGKSIHDKQATGYGGMLSFTVENAKRAADVLEKVKLISFAESLGGVETLITLPAVQTHADVPVDVRERLGISDCLLRLSVGIENAEDIIADLAQALD
ncbi:trans-sulfuration enzyme family protein [Dendrosporobacter sp. 1207_IL3150]|uniref:trans-sulfuration enzyme family protein n=1 Tax=Dendrosporobacter sp. 1207_IL3150 TaxID=3084054 RepID=UPI002FD9994E